MQKKDLQLTGTYQNIEMAIVEAIHLLAPFSEYSDDSCRCKEIYGLVKSSSIQIEGHVQQGNHRFTLFSSALCGRRSSLRLFQKVADKERHGSWWKLKVSYEDAISIAASIHSKHPNKFSDAGDSPVSPEEVVASRQEIVRNMFMSFIPLSLMANELAADNSSLEARQVELQGRVAQARAEASPETARMLDQLISLQRHLDELTQNKNAQQEMVGYHHPIGFFQ
ncbi:hypothetical protein TRFO_38044 [Tritrichomonas foetus]|uniref:Uncharacterized protein n=1 Tax=Tritrichomonas foetus TaxID=1144522 RepID=A0A1J4J9D8_9EUKA|nr:hypothetical protein TRFO_38044 [Tritrichomonas foetus]|eukprot:OHS95798.1 hypothetical protein TRFO_38044 [Tritrichomonas foetus]